MALQLPYTDRSNRELALAGSHNDLAARTELISRFIKPIHFACKRNYQMFCDLVETLKSDEYDVFADFFVYLVEKKFKIFEDIIINRGIQDKEVLSRILAGGISVVNAFIDFGKKSITKRKKAINEVCFDEIDKAFKKENCKATEEGIEESSSEILVNSNDNLAAPEPGKSHTAEDLFTRFLNKDNFPDPDIKAVFMALSINFYSFEPKDFHDGVEPGGSIVFPKDFNDRLMTLKQKIVEKSTGDDVYTIREGDIAYLFDLPMDSETEVLMVRNYIKKAKRHVCKLFGVEKYGIKKRKTKDLHYSQES
jgi:hypothetical protein